MCKDGGPTFAVCWFDGDPRFVWTSDDNCVESSGDAHRSGCRSECHECDVTFDRSTRALLVWTPVGWWRGSAEARSNSRSAAGLSEVADSRVGRVPCLSEDGDRGRYVRLKTTRRRRGGGAGNQASERMIDEGARVRPAGCPPRSPSRSMAATRRSWPSWLWTRVANARGEGGML